MFSRNCFSASYSNPSELVAVCHRPMVSLHNRVFDCIRFETRTSQQQGGHGQEGSRSRERYFCLRRSTSSPWVSLIIVLFILLWLSQSFRFSSHRIKNDKRKNFSDRCRIHSMSPMTSRPPKMALSWKRGTRVEVFSTDENVTIAVDVTDSGTILKKKCKSGDQSGTNWGNKRTSASILLVAPKWGSLVFYLHRFPGREMNWRLPHAHWKSYS